MPEATITGMLIKSRTPGQKGGTTWTITSNDRTQSVTFTDFTTFHLGDREVYQGVTVSINIDDQNARQITVGHQRE